MKLNQNTKRIITFIMAFVLIMIVVIESIWNVKLNISNDNLNTNIVEQNNKIDELTQDNKKLQSNIDILNGVNKTLQEEKNMLELANEDLLAKIEEMESRNYITTPAKRDFKSYMSYKAITNTASAQWALQQDATTNEDGIRCINGIPMVAIGTGWGLWVGDRGLVTCENGNSFEIIVGDIKSDRHTDTENKTTLSNGCRCEFIVDTAYMNPTAKAMGSMAVLSKYSGYVINIEKIN